MRPSARPPSGFPTAPSTRPLAGIDADRAYRPWNVRRPNGTRAALPNNGELRAWITDGRITPEDELSPDGQHWTPLRAIANLDVFIAAAPPARTRRASSMNMPAVRLPTDEAVRAPALGAVPAAPKVPSLAGLEAELDQAPVQPTQRVSVPPPGGAMPSVRVPPPATTSKPAPPLSPLSAGARPVASGSVPPPAAVVKNNTPSIAPLPKSNSIAPASATRSAPPLGEPLFGSATTSSFASSAPRTTNTTSSASAASPANTATSESATASSQPVVRSRTATLPPPAIAAPAEKPAQTTVEAKPLIEPTQKAQPSQVPEAKAATATTATTTAASEPMATETVALFAASEPAPVAAIASLPPAVEAPSKPAQPTETPAIFGSDSIAPPEPRRAAPTEEPSKPAAEPSKPVASVETERQRTRSMPPPPSVAVDPTLYEEASRQQSIVRTEPAGQRWKLNAALALSLLGALLGGGALAKVMTANRPVISAEPSVTGLSGAMPSPASRAELDESVESLSAAISADPSRALARVRRARMLALRAEYQRGIATDLDALAQQHSGDEAALDRAEARVLRRAAAQDTARAMGDVRAVRSVVPPANLRSEWMLSLAHAAVAHEPSSREASEYRGAALAAGAPLQLIDALVARARSEDPVAAFERARAERDAPTIATLGLVRAQRAAGRRDEARRTLSPWAAEHLDDEATVTLARSLGDAPAEAQPAPTPSANAEPATHAATNPEPANAEPAANTATNAAPASVGQSEVPAPTTALSPQYLSHVQAGRRALEFRMLPRARAEFRRALEFKSDGVEAQIGLAWVALRIGYYPVAAQSFRRLYAQGHNTPEVRAGLGLTHAKMREREPAIRYLRAYLATGPQGALAQEARQALAQLGAS